MYMLVIIRFVGLIRMDWLTHGTFSSPKTWTDDFQNYIAEDDGPFVGEEIFFGDWSDTGGIFNSGAGNSV